jgi:hypothetical protein
MMVSNATDIAVMSNDRKIIQKTSNMLWLFTRKRLSSSALNPLRHHRGSRSNLAYQAEVYIIPRVPVEKAKGETKLTNNWVEIDSYGTFENEV